MTVLLLTGCGGTHYRAPVADLDQPPSQKISSHVVAKGETLYAIAWRYNLDVRTLARVNGISEPYTIFPGQSVNLDLRGSPRHERTPQTPKTKQSPRTSQRSNIRSRPGKSPQADPKQSSALSWQWPVAGTILTRFSGPKALSKGIDIGAKNGEPVLAAESGTVVYAGNGLRGYGNLLIIKHNQNFLSAYAHNDKLLVSEGDEVDAGQQIARVGSSGTNKDKLHFEIRHDGQPVDPLRYLPKR